MRLAGERRLGAEPCAVWDFLMDPSRVKHCIPGCVDMQPVAADEFSAILDVPIPLLRGPYDARITVADAVRPEHCRLRLTSHTGFGDVAAEGSLVLSGQSGTTLLRFDGTLQLGRLTSGFGFGAKLLAAPAKLLLERFFACMDEQLRPHETTRPIM